MYIRRVGIAGGDQRRWQYTEHDLALGGGRHGRVATLAVQLAKILGQIGGDVRKGLGTVGAKVAVRLPGASKVRALLDHHSRRTKRLECHYDVCEGELGLQVELYVDTLFAVLRLPPPVKAVAVLAAHNVLDHVTVGYVAARVVSLARVTVVAYFGVACGAQHAVALGSAAFKTTCGTGVKKFCSSDKQVASLWVAVAACAAGGSTASIA